MGHSSACGDGEASLCGACALRKNRGPISLKNLRIREKDISTQWRCSILGCWTQLCGMTLKCSVLLSLPRIRELDYENVQKSYSCSSLLLLCRRALQSSVSLSATAALLPGGLPLSPQQGISGAGVSTLKWRVLTNHYSEKYNNTLELSQSCCSNVCV